MRFNGVELRSVHRALSIEKEIPPGTAGRQIKTIEGADGEIVTEERLSQSEYIVRVNIVGSTREEGWAVREMLAEWASLRAPGTAELIPTARPSRCYDARLKSISDPEFVRGGAKVEVRFLIPRPVSRDISARTASGAGCMTAHMRGSYSCRPVITQTIAGDHDGLVWTMDGIPILSVNGALRAGQVVRMDTRNASLTIDGEHAEERIDVLKTKWRPGYWPGRHEMASTDAGVLGMRWHDEWV